MKKTKKQQHKGMLNYVFLDGWIGRGGPTSWPPRSPDVTPLDFFLWGYVKTKVFHWVLDGDPTRDHDTGHVHHGVHDLRCDDQILVHVVIVRPNEIPLVHTKLDSS